MRKANFRLPYTHDMNLPDSMYKQQISTKVNIDATKDARPSAIKYDPSADIVGNKCYQQPFISENTNQFKAKASNMNQVENDGIKANIKKSHFELGYGPGGKTLNTTDTHRNKVSSSYNFTGSGQQNLLNNGPNQRATHFKMGYGDFRPKSGEWKNSGSSNFIQKSINSTQNKTYLHKPSRTIENGQISAMANKKNNWGF